MAGCAQTARTVATQTSHVETVAFTTTTDRVSIIDAATSVLVSSNFSITLANDRIGLLQTDYVPVSSVQSVFADSLSGLAVGDNLLMRVTVNAEDQGESNYVQVKGNFQSVSGATNNESLIGLFWLERVTKRMADALDVTYTRQLSDSTYVQAIAGAASVSNQAPLKSNLKRAFSAVGIVIAVLFAATLMISTFGPGSDREAPTQ